MGTCCDNRPALGGGRFCVSRFLFGAVAFGLGGGSWGCHHHTGDNGTQDEASAVVLAALLNRAADGDHEWCAGNFGKCCSITTVSFDQNAEP